MSAIQKVGWLYLVAGILPHGIIELPVVLVSIAIGFRLGYLLALSLLREKADLSGEIRMAFHFLVRWVTPLLLWPRPLKLLSPPLLYRWLHDRFQD